MLHQAMLPDINSGRPGQRSDDSTGCCGNATVKRRFMSASVSGSGCETAP
jgi:hypothetical protein